MADEHNGRLDWASMQDSLQNSVVQVVAQVAKFNWEEPYAIEDEYESRGSGFFIDSNGYIITNAHVVDEATVVWIHLPSLGKKTIFTDIIGFCPERDLALLKVKDEDFEFLKGHMGSIMPLPFGDSDAVKRTDQVLMLGYPLGHYIMKSSTGVVSGRESYGGYSLIQITAPINAGNSGGPLINSNGEVIGIAIATVNGAQNIGFGIPINELKIILDDLRTLKLVRSQMLGVQLNYATEELAEFFNNPSPAGVYIGKVFKNSLAEKVGMQAGDMLYSFNDYRIDAFGDATVPWTSDKITMNDLVARLKRGQMLTLIVYRNGKKLVLSIPFEQTTPNPIRKIYPNYEPVEYEVIGGMIVMQLVENHINLLTQNIPYLVEFSKADRRYEKVLVITHVLPGSYIQQMRSLFAGFIITQVNGIDVSTLQEFRRALIEGLATDRITIKTSDGVFAVMPFTTVLKDERRLAQNFSYRISGIVEDLLKAID